MVESGVSTAFQIAAAAGPLCAEPMWGVALEVDCLLHEGEGEKEGFGPLSRQVISTAADCFRRALQETQPRLAEAMYLCEVTTAADALAGAYAALGKRRARVISEDAREGTDLFVIRAYLPVEASFGFAGELRRRSSGAASAQLLLSHWERLHVDPFFVPRTPEEREEFGEAGQGQGGTNVAEELIRQVRRRKGLPVEEKVVESATKQRTLARKK